MFSPKNNRKRTTDLPGPYLLLFDLTALLAAFLLASFSRGFFAFGEPLPQDFRIPIIYYLLIGLVWVTYGLLTSLYRTVSTRPHLDEFANCIGGAVVTIVLAYLLASHFLSASPRSLFALAFVYFIILLVGYRLFIIFLLLPRIYASWKPVFLRFGSFFLSTNASLHRLYFDVAFAFIASVSLACLLYSVGLNYSPDSVEYTLAGAQLRYSGHFAMLPDWPPLFPLLIGLATFFTPFPADAAALVVAISVIFVAVVFSFILRSRSASVWVNLVAITLLLSMSAFFAISLSAWSEMPFVAFMLASLFFADKAIGSKEKVSMVPAFIFASLAILTRYIGVFLPLVLSIEMLQHAKKGKGRRVWQLIWLNAIAYLPLAIYFVRNLIVTGTIAGPRVLASLDIGKTLTQAGSVFLNDLGRPLVFVLLIVFAYYAFRSRVTVRSNKLLEHASLMISLFFLIFLIYSSSRYVLDPINSRLLFPIYPLTLIFLFAILPQLLLWIRFWRSQYLKLFVRLAIGISLGVASILSLGYFADNVAELTRVEGSTAFHYEAGYSSSKTAADISRISAEVVEHENFEIIFLQTRFEIASRLFLLQKVFYQSTDIQGISYTFEDSNSYQVELAFNGGTHSIVYHFTPDFANPADLTDAISQEKPASAFAIIYSADSVGIGGRDLVAEYYAKMYTRVKYEAAPYSIDVFYPNLGPDN